MYHSCFARGRLKYTESLQKIALHWCQQNLLLSFLNTIQAQQQQDSVHYVVRCSVLHGGTLLISTSLQVLIPPSWTWRGGGTPRTTPLRWGATRPPAVPWTPGWSSQDDWTSAGWRCEPVVGSLAGLETALRTRPHIRAPEACVVPYCGSNLGPLWCGPQWCQDPGLSRMEPCPASGDDQTRRCHRMAPDWSADVSRRRKIEHEPKFTIQLCQFTFFPFKIS